MKKNPLETIMGFFVLIFALVFAVFALLHVDTKRVKGYQLNANFLKTGGLEAGADVRISGVKVGSVLSTSLNKDTYTADVVLSIDPTVRLPLDTSATIADLGLMGGKYIRLEPGKSQAFLVAGDKLRHTKNYKSLEDSVSEFIFLSTK